MRKSFRNLSFLRKFTAVALASLLASSTWADIFVDRAIVRLGADKPPREDVKVINDGSEVGYVSVEVFEVQNPGTESEQRVRVTDPDQVKLLASPSKLMIPPNSQKLVRIVNLEPANDQERIYRINVTPVLPPLQEDQGSVVRVVVAYQLLVIVDPTEPREELEIRRQGYQLKVTNKGNTNVLLSDGEQCDEQGENCVQIPAHRVYPGNQWQIDLERDAPVAFSLTSHTGVREFRTK
ncbi:fimbria/pilus periplasmic chaperone [Proteobacteria bacterium 005FR1]|nr:fimbria/pilus periplasmic chaperone [Proteobacteria bacterium 005FR1]